MINDIMPTNNLQTMSPPLAPPHGKSVYGTVDTPNDNKVSTMTLSVAEAAQHNFKIKS